MAIHVISALQVEARKDLSVLVFLPGTLADNPGNMVGHSFFSLLGGSLRREAVEDDLELERRVVMMEAGKNKPGDRLSNLFAFLLEPVNANV